MTLMEWELIFHHFLPTPISGGFPLSCQKWVFLFSCSQTARIPTKLPWHQQIKLRKIFGMQNFMAFGEDFVPLCLVGCAPGLCQSSGCCYFTSAGKSNYRRGRVKKSHPAQAGCWILLETSSLLRMMDFHGISSIWAGSRVSEGTWDGRDSKGATPGVSRWVWSWDFPAWVSSSGIVILGTQ